MNSTGSDQACGMEHAGPAEREPANSTEHAYGFHGPVVGAQADRSTGIGRDALPDSSGIKRKALELGADIVGVCRLNPQWLRETSSLRNGRGIVDLPWVVVIGVAMYAEMFRTSPSPAIRQETRRGYRRMKEIACGLGEYFGELGHRAFAVGNGEALSIPLAIDAGTGQLGRNSMLITPEYGPCLRICKVFTDIPLNPDTKPTSVLAERCENCTACSEACPANAIEPGRKPSRDRWRLDTGLCGRYWREANRECAACISACPATWQGSG